MSYVLDKWYVTTPRINRELARFAALCSMYRFVVLRHSDDINNTQTTVIDDGESETEGALRSHRDVFFIGTV